VKSAAPPSRGHSLGATAPSGESHAPHFSVALPGPRSRTSGAGGLQLQGARPGSPAGAARGRSASSASTTPSRAAVTGATSSRRCAATPSGFAASGLTADPAHNASPSAGPGAARPADLPAFSLSNHASATGTTTPATSLTRIASSLLTVNERPISAQTFRVIPLTHRTTLRPSPPASTGTSRGVPAGPSNPIRPAREAGHQEEN
jgi:hypothetical protein